MKGFFNKQRISTFGLLFITVLAAIQYVFIQNVPDSVSTFAFLCLTNLVGFVIVGIVQIKKLITIKKPTILKGILFAVLLTGFNFFMILGSRGTDAVVISSVLSMYFVFITPILILLKKKVNFFSGIASVLAIIALILMFQADTAALFGSSNVIYLLISDIFFAAYVVCVSIMGEKEDSVQLTLSQMIFATIFAFAGWGIEALLGVSQMSIPSGKSFWISVFFIGIFIRAVYGLIQMACQKNVPALNASLIFASEIIITLVLDPFLCKLFKLDYTPATIYQIVGCILFIVATLIVDDVFMSKLGFEDIELKDEVDETGKVTTRSSVSRKMIFITLSFSIATLIIVSVICLLAIQFIRNTAVSNSTTLGKDASIISEVSLTSELETELTRMVQDKARIAELKLNAYTSAINTAVSYAETLYADPDNYGDKEVLRPDPANGGIWAMQRVLANESIAYDDVIDESMLIGNMVDSFAPIINNNENIVTIYMGTERGMLVSYDQNSNDGDPDNESYYEYRERPWYVNAKEAGKCIFTDPYYDDYGRGLTITCAAPYYDENHNFLGCIAMDILVDSLNNSMVSDNVFDPNVATLIDRDGGIIAGLGISDGEDENASIFDPKLDHYLYPAGETILATGEGIMRLESKDGEIYVAYATIDSLDWILNVICPVDAIIAPAVTIRNNIDNNTQIVVDSVVEVILAIIQTLLIVIALMLIIIILLVGKSSKKIVDPIKQLEKDVLNISNGDFSQRTSVDTNDEIGKLARAFNLMTASLQQHIDELKEATVREERIASELSVATKIQADMLPSEFPAFPGRKDFDIYATMNPAKEVGGDFYDYFMPDDNHLGIVIADVSGKGVPAALFMVIAKTLLKYRTLMGGNPSKILEDVNMLLCENNKAELFVTVWLAVVDLTTGKGAATNAGHEYPVFKHKDGEFELIKNRHSAAAGILEDMAYGQVEFEIQPGDRLFVYTDGVPEATNKDNELFGTDRMVESLNRNKDKSLKEMLVNLKKDIDEFVGDAPQFDDVTMLGFEYYGANRGSKDGE